MNNHRNGRLRFWQTRAAAYIRKCISRLDEMNDAASDAFADALSRLVRRWGLILTVALLLAGAVIGAAAGITTRQAKTAAPSTITGTATSNAEGTSDAFARADHGHACVYTGTGTGAVGRACSSKLSDIVSVKDFSGASVGEQIDAACASFAGGHGVVEIPGDVGNGNSIIGIPEGCLVWDWRGLGGPSQGGDEGPVSAYLKGGILRTRWTSAPVAVQNYQTLLLYGNPASGGVNMNNGPKTNYSVLTSNMYATTPGQHLGNNAQVWGTGPGDNIAFAGTAVGYGGASAMGDQGTQGISAFAYQGGDVFTATVSSVVDNGSTITVNYTSPLLENRRGEQRYLIDITKAVTTGTTTGTTGIPPAVTFNGVNLGTALGVTPPVSYANGSEAFCFSMTGDDNDGLKLVIPIRSIDSATQVTLNYNVAGADDSMPGVTSGTYRIYPCGRATSVVGTGSIILNKGTTQWAAADSIEMPVGFNFMGGLGALSLTQHLPVAPHVRGGSLTLNNSSSKKFPGNAALFIDGPWDQAIQILPGATAAQFGILYNTGPAPATFIQISDNVDNRVVTTLSVARNVGTGGNSVWQYNKSVNGWSTGDDIYAANFLPSGAFKSRTGAPAATGLLRLASGDSICWRNAANNADVCISKNASDQIQIPVISKRVAGCATAAAAGSVCSTTVTWPTAFADTNYTVNCTGSLITSGVPVNGGLNAKAAASVTFQTVAMTAAAAQFTNIECTANHD